MRRESIPRKGTGQVIITEKKRVRPNSNMLTERMLGPQMLTRYKSIGAIAIRATDGKMRRVTGSPQMLTGHKSIGAIIARVIGWQMRG